MVLPFNDGEIRVHGLLTNFLIYLDFFMVRPFLDFKSSGESVKSPAVSLAGPALAGFDAPRVTT
jgi:hypothetical protein